MVDLCLAVKRSDIHYLKMVINHETLDIKYRLTIWTLSFKKFGIQIPTVNHKIDFKNIAACQRKWSNEPQLASLLVSYFSEATHPGVNFIEPGIQMVGLCLVVKWSSIQMVVWKPGWKNPVYGPKCPVFEWSSKSCDCHLNTVHPYCPVFRCIWYSGVQYSDGYCTGKLRLVFHSSNLA